MNWSEGRLRSLIAVYCPVSLIGVLDGGGGLVWAAGSSGIGALGTIQHTQQWR